VPLFTQPAESKRAAYQFIILMGLVSLLGDVTYEGARSIAGPFLATLGASAALVGVISGLGEFLGYALRLASGYAADRTRGYWPLTIAGYALMLSIPALAWAGHWQVAALFMILERVGKAVRSPARDTLLSHATSQVGRGWGFGLHEAMDQIGAVAGPLLFSAVILLKGGYARGYLLLGIPALLTLVVLLGARWKFPAPERLEAPAVLDPQAETRSLPPVFWYYAVFILFTVMGFVGFPLAAYHLKTAGVVSDAQIPFLYAVAMGVDALVALAVGKWYDRAGLPVLVVIPVLSALIPFFIFARMYSLIVVGVVLWGAAMAVHETIMRAAIADLTHLRKRGFGYGIFNTVYGLGFLLGGVLMGLLYERSLVYVQALVVGLQVAALPAFWLVRRAAAVKPGAA
jgi:predicted MFS family arabinose efflux permease